MAYVIYSLCALTAGLCAWLLLQSYSRSRYKLLLWGGLCFVGLTVNNVLLIIDKSTSAEFLDLAIWRLGAAFASTLILLYGLIWDTE